MAQALHLRSLVVLQAPLEKSSSGVPRVLLTEDEPSTLNVLVMLLRHAPFDVEFASGGEEAVTQFMAARAGSSPFALCVLDVHMPGVDGFQAAAKIRSLDASVRIVFLTAYEVAAEDPRSRELNIADCWLKPCAVPQLKVLICKALGLHHESASILGLDNTVPSVSLAPG